MVVAGAVLPGRVPVVAVVVDAEQLAGKRLWLLFLLLLLLLLLFLIDVVVARN